MRLHSAATALLTLMAVAPLASARTVFQHLHDFAKGPGHSGSELVADANGVFYGTADGGPDGTSVIFKVNSDGTGFGVVYSLPSRRKFFAPAELVLSGSMLYGTTLPVGSTGHGSVFKVGTDGTGFQTLHAFVGTDGSFPEGGLSLAGGDLWGTTNGGGGGNAGVVFKIASDGSSFSVVHDFVAHTDGGYPLTGLRLSLDGLTFYGVNSAGGLHGFGTIFKVAAEGTFTTLYDFTAPDGHAPGGRLIEISSALYGTTIDGGVNGLGTVFKLDLTNALPAFTTLISFTSLNGTHPSAGLATNGTALFGTTTQGGAHGFGTVFGANLTGPPLTMVFDFTGTNGALPSSALLDRGGVLYGVTNGGGALNQGTLFKIGEDGTQFNTVFDFGQTDGMESLAGLLDDSGFLYGTNVVGGAGDRGTIFRVGEDGAAYAVLHAFDSKSAVGSGPQDALVSMNGHLYGTIANGGASGLGLIFQIDRDGGGFIAVHDFVLADGNGPRGLAAIDNVLYGVAHKAGDNGTGLLYRVLPDNSIQKVLSFTAEQGDDPMGAVTELDGVLYGTTRAGGASGRGVVFRVNKDGTLPQKIHEFESDEGMGPNATLLLSQSVLYGTTARGGAHDAGTVFAIHPDGTGFQTIATFDVVQGANPSGAALAVAHGWLYGTTLAGGAHGLGTAFRVRPDGAAFEKLADFDAASGGPAQGLVRGADKELYTVTGIGGAHGGGSVLRVATVPEISIADASRKEGDTGTHNLEFVVTLSAPPKWPVTVDFVTADGTAKASRDYTTTSGTLSFSENQVSTTILVLIQGDVKKEKDETVLVDLTNPTDAVIARSRATGTIVNDDAPLALSVYPGSVREGDSGTRTIDFQVTLSLASSKAVQVSYATSRGTATAGEDYVKAAGQLSFAPGETSHTVSVIVNGDTEVEGNETFFLNLSDPVNAVISIGRASGTIIDDDVPPPIARRP